MKVYLDDERTPPDGWYLVRWPDEAIALLETSAVTHLSLDHDLGDDARGTGYDVLLWIEEAVARRGFNAPHIFIHSANSSARVKMLGAVDHCPLCTDNRLLCWFSFQTRAPQYLAPSGGTQRCWPPLLDDRPGHLPLSKLELARSIEPWSLGLSPRSAFISKRVLCCHPCWIHLSKQPKLRLKPTDAWGQLADFVPPVT